MFNKGIRTALFIVIVILSYSLLFSACKSAQAPATEPPANAESSYSSSVRQGFNFEKDAQICVGFVNYLKIADQMLAQDLNVTDPQNVSNRLKVFGVLSSIYWNGGYADPVQFSCQVTTDNKNILATLVHKTLSNTEIEFAFTVYDFDPKQKKYYKAFHTDGVTLKGLILKSGGELAMAIDNNASGEVVSPKNYTFMLGVMPQDVAQQIHIAVSVSDKFVKTWGVAVAR